MRQSKRLGFGLAVVLALSLSAAAQRYHGGSLEPRQHGFEHGYRDGFDRGRQDRGQNLSYNPREDFRMADRAYDPYMGNHEDFIAGYRDGYKAGYDDAFNRQAGRWDSTYGIDPGYDPERRYPNDTQDGIYEDRRWGSQDVAYDIGYRDGVSMGQHDAGKHKDFRPQKNDQYEDADHGYRKSYGDKNSYKSRYREGFLRGYQDGYGRWR